MELQAGFKTSGVGSAAVDVHGDLYLTGLNPNGYFLAKSDPEGKVLASVSGNNPNEGPVWISLDSSGGPQIVIVTDNSSEFAIVRRYSADLSAVLFERMLAGFYLQQFLGPDGGTLLIGGTEMAPPMLHPTAVCNLSSSQMVAIETAAPNFTQGVMARLDNIGRLIQSTFVAIPWGYC